MKHGITRAAYHDGDLTGVCIKILIGEAENIMGKIKEYLLRSKGMNCTMSNDDICKLCDDIELLLVRWDVALSMLHHEDLGEAKYLQAQEYIDATIELMRDKLKGNITIKGRGGETHIHTITVSILPSCSQTCFVVCFWMANTKRVLYLA